MTAVLYDIPGPRARRRALIGGVIGTMAVVAMIAGVVMKLAAENQFEAAKWQPFTDPDILTRLGEGLLATIRAATISILLALVFGAAFAAGRLSDRPWMRLPSIVVVEFFRSVPLVLLILFVFLAFAQDFETFGRSVSGVLPDGLATLVGADQFGTLGPLAVALMLYNGSVLAEVFRAGIFAVPRGQAEAGYAIGLRKTQVMSLILVPQAARIMLPAIVSQCVVALKDTALGGVIIGYGDLVREGRGIYDLYFNIIPTAIVIGVIYIAINISLSRLVVWLERRQAEEYGAEAVERVEAAVDVH
jgi:glutamate transport system permease protein